MTCKRYFFAMLLISSALSALSLDDAVALGLKHNHSLASTALQAELSASKTKEVHARHFGEIDTVATYRHYNTPRTLYPLTPASIASGAGSVATTQDLFTTGLRYSVPLFSGYAIEDETAVARLQKKMADLEYRLGREELIFTIRSVYVDALSLRASWEAWKAYSDAMDRLYDNTQKKVTLGKKAPLELLQVDAQRLKSETEQEKLDTQLQTLMSLLALLTGRSEPVEALEEVTWSPPESVAPMTRKSSRLAVAELGVETAEKNVHKSNASVLPQVGMEAYYGYSYGPNDGANPRSGDWEHQELWDVGLSLQWKLFDFGKRSAGTQQARIVRLQQESRLEQARLQVAHEVRQAQLEFTMAQRRFTLAQKEFELMRKTEEVETLRYRLGQIDMNDLLIQKASTQLALGEMIASRYSVLKSHYALEYLYEEGDPL